MLTTSEKNFIRDWQIQKEGPRWKYYLQYIIAWATVIFLALFFLTNLILASGGIEGWLSFFIISGVSVGVAFIITHMVYQSNERKLQRLIAKRKKEDGMNSGN